ncbi:MAG: mercuric reductase [Calditrichaeota bacterium]|nr:mercuric reductase [Calditrichota bacterium]RQW01756.1 MAG: mercuric reductase [Calditrichota bacterium]
MMDISGKHFQAIIIGTGQSGKPLATDLGKAGWPTAVIEQQFVGGSCINYGCTPTKSMIASARAAYVAKKAADYGVQVSQVKVDLEKIIQRKDGIVKSFRESGRKSLENTPNVILIDGKANLKSSHEVVVNKKDGTKLTLTGERIIINTGANPRIPDIPGLSSIPYLTSTSILDLTELPSHLIIIGGGYIGLEFGQMFRRFGSDVTIIQRGDQLLSREDRDVAGAVAEILREDKIMIELKSEPVKVQKIQNGNIEVTIETGTKTKTISGSHLLVAAGRIPASNGLGLENAGVATDSHGYIISNEYLESSVNGIFVMGDVKGGPAFTHISYDDYRVLKKYFLENERQSIEGRFVPYTVFIDPQLGRVGLSGDQARKKGLKIRVAKMPMKYSARAIETGETRGFMKVIINASTREILGCAILSSQGGEIMSLIQVSMMGKLPYTALRDAIFAHPTLAESLNNLFGAI